MEEHFQEQGLLIDQLVVHIKVMEGKLCQCNEENEEVSPVLGSCLFLHHNIEGPSGNENFRTPLSSDSSLSHPSTSSLISTLVEVVENKDAPVENMVATHVPPPSWSLTFA